MSHKQLLLRLLVDILGEFVDGITEQNLKVGVWNGKIKLRDLSINKKGFEKFNLPLMVKEGWLKTLEVQIPWTRLEKSPVKMVLKDLFVVVSPLDLSDLTADKAQALCEEKIKEQLEKAERIVEYAAADLILSGYDEKKSYRNRIFQKVMKNLEISIHNVHLRCDFNPVVNCCCGVTLDLFSFKNSNENWQDNDKEDLGSSIISYKMVSLLNLGMYWNSSSSYNGYSYIVSPLEKVHIKIALNNKANATPQSVVVVDLCNLSVRISKTQLHQALIVMNKIATTGSKLYIVKHRPRVSAIKKPFYWWKYLIMLLTNKEHIFDKKIEKAMVCCKHRKRYISLMVKSRSMDMETRSFKELTPQENTELQIIEAIVPVEALIVFRQLAIKEALVLNEKNKEKFSNKKYIHTKFSLFKKLKTHEADDKDSIAQRNENLSCLEEELKNIIFSSDAIDNILFTIDFECSFNVCMVLLDISKPVASIQALIHTKGSIRASSADISIGLSNVLVSDLVSQKAMFSEIIKFGNFDSGNNVIAPLELLQSKPNIVLKYEKIHNSSSKFCITAQPFCICYNFLCIHSVQDVFDISQSDIVWSRVTEDFKVLFGIIDLSRTDKKLSFFVDLQCVNVLLPDPENSGCVSRLCFKSAQSSGEVVSNGIDVYSDVLIGHTLISGIFIDVLLPKNEILATSRVVEEFDFAFHIQSLEQCGDCFTLELHASPGISLSSDVEVLSELFSCLQQLINTKKSQSSVEDVLSNRVATAVERAAKSSSRAVSEALSIIHSKIRNDPMVYVLSLTCFIPYFHAKAANALVPHMTSLDIDNINFVFKTRLHDFEISADIGGLTINEVYKDENIQILKTQEEYFAHMSYFQILDEKSPFGGSDINTKIDCDIGDVTLFLNSLTARRLNTTCSSSFGHLTSQEPTGCPARTPHETQENVPLEGFALAVRLSKLAVFLDKERCHLADVNLNSKNYSNWEHVILCEATALDFHVKCSRNYFISASGSVDSVGVKDKRDISGDYCYNDMLCPFEACDLNISMPKPQDWSLEDKQRPKPKFLTISFKQDEKNSRTIRTIEAFVSPLKAFVSLDIILEVSYIVLDFLDALKTSNSVRQSTGASSHNALTNIRNNSSMFHIIFLENPIEEDSEGIVCRGTFEMNCRQDATLFDDEIVNSIHVSLHEVEFFVLLNMMQWHPHHLIERFAIEFHVATVENRGTQTQATMSIYVSEISGTLTLNDLVLLDSIWMRRGMANNNHASQTKSANLFSIKEGEPSALVFHNVFFSADTFSLQLINDFEENYISLATFKLEQTSCQIEGFIQDLEGTGSLTASAKFFNSKMCEWEPLLEGWRLQLLLSSTTIETCIDLASESHTQFNITNDFLEMALQTLSLINTFRCGTERKIPPTITFKNSLGLPISILDGETKQHLFSSEGNEEIGIYVSSNFQGRMKDISSAKSSTFALTSIPPTIDLHFVTEKENDYCPLIRVPFQNANITLKYSLVSLKDSDTEKLDSVVCEEIFEYQRFSPLSMSWIDPFLSADPCRWSDASGIINKGGKNCIKLPLTDKGWRWIEDWRVDVSATVGSEIDSEGFHYGFDFYSICGHEGTVRPRCYKALDCVRRRRWVRRRARDDASRTSKLVFWDERTEKTGTRLVHIRSALQVHNCLPFDLTVVTGGGVDFGPIAEDDVYSFPMNVNNISSLSFRPSFLPAEDSALVNCFERSNDYMSVHHVRCLMKSDGKSFLSVNVLVNQSDRSTLISVFPFAEVFNALPCSATVKFINLSNEVIDQDFFEPATRRKLSFLSPQEKSFLSLKLSGYEWSQPQEFPRQRDSILSIRLVADNMPALNIFVKTKYFNTKTSKIELFAKYAFVDYSKLNISLRLPHNKDNNPHSWVSYTSTDIEKLKSLEHRIPREEINDPLQSTVSNLVVKSRLQYKVNHAVCIGDYVHNDRMLLFEHIPPALLHQVYISTAFEDRTILMNDDPQSCFMSFHVSRDSLVLVMIEGKASAPKWMCSSNFVRVLESVVASESSHNKDHDDLIHYTLYGKVFGEGRVCLGSNYSKDARGMYGVFVIHTQNENCRYLFNQVAFSESYSSDNKDKKWCSGGMGVRLFSTDECDDICLGVNGSSWCNSNVDLANSIVSTKMPFEIIDDIKEESYQLVYNIETLPGVFHRMKILEVMPQYLIVNATNEEISIRQDMPKDYCFKAEHTMEIQPFCMRGWHKTIAKGGTSIQVRLSSTRWCGGSIDINEVGLTEILLSETAADMKLRSVVLNVEVKLSSDSDKCLLTVVFWKSLKASESPLSISNQSSFMLAIRQVRAAGHFELKDYEELTIPPKTKVPYGWSNPSIGAMRRVSICVGSSFNSEVGIVAQIDVLDISQKSLLYLKNAEDVPVAVISIELQSTGQTILIVDHEEVSQSETAASNSTRSCTLKLSVKSVGFSLIACTPRKRELISLHIDELVIAQLYIANGLTLDMRIGNVQIDNFCETAVYPVLFRRYNNAFANAGNADVDAPFIHLAMAKEVFSGSEKIKYLSLIVLKFVVEIDSGSIYILFSDLFSGIDFVSQDKLKAISHPKDWMLDFNRKIVSIDRYEAIGIMSILKTHQQTRMLFENLEIHPLKCYLTFVHTERLQRDDTSSSPSSYVEWLASVGAVELMVIRINSFVVSNAVESISSLKSRIVAKIKRDLRMQLAQIAGSLTILGSPVGLVRNIGSGVKSFFYEPAAGLVKSPISFVVGIQRGTSGLVSGVLSGALNTTAALVSTASSGLSVLSGDVEYMQQRSLTMKRQQAARGGVLAGFRHGGITAFSGIASGVSGVILRPIEGAHREGSVGFVKGFGKGLAGAAVKPILGVTDGLTSIFQGISNEVGCSSGHSHLRPPRAFKRFGLDFHDYLLVELDLNDAYAQAYIAQSSAEKSDDEFVAQITMENSTQVIFSDKRVWWVSPNGSSSLLWDDISYVLLREKECKLEIHLSAGSSAPQRIALTRRFASQVHAAFLAFADRMTNPSVMMNALTKNCGKLDNHSLISSAGMSGVSPSGANGPSEEYQFGSHNCYEKGPVRRLLESDLVNETRAKFLMGASVDSVEKSISLKNNNTFPCHYSSDSQRICLEYIDSTVSCLVHQWDGNHSAEVNGLSFCCCTLIINLTDLCVEVSEIDLQCGREMWLIGSEGSFCAVSNDDVELKGKKLIPAGGYVLCLGCGHKPSPYHSGSVEYSIQTNAFEAFISNDNKRTAILSQGDSFSTQFCERTVLDTWSKYVLFVTKQK